MGYAVLRPPHDAQDVLQTFVVTELSQSVELTVLMRVACYLANHLHFLQLQPCRNAEARIPATQSGRRTATSAEGAQHVDAVNTICLKNGKMICLVSKKHPTFRGNRHTLVERSPFRTQSQRQ